ncbi:MAG: hypothetical protein IKB73_05490 [Ruminococcus sp.]|nr:hypothetical protein [Ruminococcus sp.]
MKNKSLKDIFDNPKITKISVIIGVVAVVLIFISSYIDFSVFSQKVDTDEYCLQLEENLHNVVTHIQGVGNAKIFLTMDNNGENVYLDNSDTKTKSITPVVRGVVVVCDGGDDPIVISRVMSAITKSLNISSNKVCVTKLTE